MINLGYYVKWKFSDRDRPLDRFRITKSEVKFGFACGEDKDCLGGKICWKTSISKDEEKVGQ